MVVLTVKAFRSLTLFEQYFIRRYDGDKVVINDWRDLKIASELKYIQSTSVTNLLENYLIYK